MRIRRYNGGLWITPHSKKEGAALDAIHDALEQLFRSAVLESGPVMFGRDVDGSDDLRLRGEVSPDCLGEAKSTDQNSVG